MKRKIYIDMDDTLADFQNSPAFKGMSEIDDSLMYERGFFRDLPPVPGALVAIRKLIKRGFDVQILTQPVANSAHSYSEKVQWVGMWLPELLSKINMVQDKGIIRGDFLVDDNLHKWMDKFEADGGGRFIHFDYKRTRPDLNEAAWGKIVDFFMNLSTEK